MAVDPRKFLVSDCPVDQQTDRAGANSKRSFFRALGKIGDLEVLNDVGAGKVGEGLRTLTHVSNAIRTGRSVVPGKEGEPLFDTALGRIVGTAADAVDKGANVVLDTCGLGAVTAGIAGNFQPGVANRAYGSAKQIYEKVKSGNFKITDIPYYFQDLQNLEMLLRGIFTGKRGQEARTVQGCVSPYAVDLIAFAPKFKHLFVVQFTFSQEYTDWMNLGNDLAFVVKSSTRPTVEFEYDEVNMYNFRTRIAKRTTYQPITMSFLDDNKNNANLFYAAYTRAMSPGMNMGGPGNDAIPEVELYQATSMTTEQIKGTTFGPGSPAVTKGGASLGALNNNTKNILREVRLFHVFDYGRLMNVYHFYHPKILQLNLDELDMSSPDGASLSLEFGYDGLYFEPNYSVRDTTTYNLSELTGASRNAKYPIRKEFGDSTDAEDGTPNAPSSQNSLPLGALDLIAPSILPRGGDFNIPGFGGTVNA